MAAAGTSLSTSAFTRLSPSFSATAMSRPPEVWGSRATSARASETVSGDDGLAVEVLAVALAAAGEVAADLGEFGDVLKHGQPGGLEDDADVAVEGHLQAVAQQAVAGDVRAGVDVVVLHDPRRRTC